MRKILLIFLALTLAAHAAEFTPYPDVPPKPKNFPKAARSGERVGITSAIIAANAGLLAILAVLALSNTHDHSHAH